MSGMTLGGKYKVGTFIGSGTFGEIYEAERLGTTKRYAVKLEKRKAKSGKLRREAQIYKLLGDSEGFARLKWIGTENDYDGLVMDLLGKNLEEIFKESTRRFTLKTVLMIAYQMLERIEFLHSKGILHRDIKPDNFGISRNNCDDFIYLFDFGLSKKYRRENGEHVQFRDRKTMVGTARYASINSMMGMEQSRRDDLESIGYCLIYFMKGSLPWQGMKGDEQRDRNEAILQMKLTTSIEDLCRGIPREFATFLAHVRSLEFTEDPNYMMYKTLFRNLAMRERVGFDGRYDWKVAKPPEALHAQSQKRFDFIKHMKLPVAPLPQRMLSGRDAPVPLRKAFVFAPYTERRSAGSGGLIDAGRVITGNLTRYHL